MRRRTTKEILADAFREVAEVKDVNKIKVKGVTDNCGYSTATFYRHFRDKYDLIAWDYSRRVGEIMDRMGSEGYAWRDTLLDGARYFEKDKAYLGNLFLHTTGLESFLRNMTDTHDRYFRACIASAMGGQSPDEITYMYIHGYCHGTVALICEWVLGEYSVSAETLAEVFERSLPDPLKVYLYPPE